MGLWLNHQGHVWALLVGETQHHTTLEVGFMY